MCASTLALWCLERMACLRGLQLFHAQCLRMAAACAPCPAHELIEVAELEEVGAGFRKSVAAHPAIAAADAVGCDAVSVHVPRQRRA